MKSIVRAVLASALLGTAVAAVLPAAAAENKISRDVAKSLQAAQKALQPPTPDYATALADVKDAQAVTDRTPYDDLVINEVLAQIYIQQKDYTDATAPVEAIADSPALPDDQKKGAFANAFQLAMVAKHYDKAIGYGQQLQTLNALTPAIEADLGVAYYFTKDMAHAQQYAQMSIDADKAAGNPPNENALKIVENAEAAQNNTGALQGTLENLAMTYNQPDTWNKLITLALQTKGIKDIDELYLLRLKTLLPSTMVTEDYTGLAAIADAEGYSTEALNILQKGMQAGKVTSSQAGVTLTHARNGANQDARDLPKIAAEAERAKKGEADIKLAEDYWGYGRFADAEVAARRAIAKGGLKDPSEGPMLLGMILVAEKKYSDAVQSLSQVSGSAPRNAAAHVWSLYAQAQIKAQGAAQPAPH